MNTYKKLLLCVLLIFAALFLFGCLSAEDYVAGNAYYGYADDGDEGIYISQDDEYCMGDDRAYPYYDTNTNGKGKLYDAGNEDGENGIVEDLRFADTADTNPHPLFPVVVFRTLEDLENIDLNIFEDSPYFTPEQNMQLKRLTLEFALFTYGFDMGDDIWTMIDEEANQKYVREMSADFYNSFGLELGRPYLVDVLRSNYPFHFWEFWVATDFMTQVGIEDDRIYITVRTRAWPPGQPHLDAGSWLTFVFIDFGGQYKLIDISADA